MKKLIAGLFAAILTTAGLVAVTSTAPASAACTQYVCNNTSSTAKPAPKTIKAGKPAKVRVAVKTRGNIKPKGTVTITIKGKGVNKTIRKAYNGKTLNLNLGKLRKAGKYKVTVTFKGAQGFKDSKTTTTITVKKAKKRR